jgi:hypothetical protein
LGERTIERVNQFLGTVSCGDIAFSKAVELAGGDSVGDITNGGVSRWRHGERKVFEYLDVSGNRVTILNYCELIVNTFVLLAFFGEKDSAVEYRSRSTSSLTS